MKVKDNGKCELCNVEDDIHHILYKCPRFDHIRKNYPTLENQTPIKTIYEQKDANTLNEIIYYLN
jgi:hypothetical protein